MIHSLYLDAKQGCPSGFPIWGYFNNETFIMNGYSGLPLIANLYAFGGRNINLQAINDKMIWAADHKYRRGEEYIEFGYVPDYESEWNYCVSMTIEYSIDDFAVAQMSRYAGDSSSYQRFLDRSGNVFNLFNEQTGYLQRKSRDESWVVPFDSAAEVGFNEGNSAQYTWNIPHNLPKLVSRIGGSEATISRLDHFTSKILTDNWNVDVPYYWPANQPSFVVPYVYIYAGAPGKAQQLIRESLATIFSNTPGGLPGNDDLGATSAMFLFQTAGIYPLKPGIPEFTLSGSFVDKLTFHLDNEAEITVKGSPSRNNKTVRSIRINGELHQGHSINIENVIEEKADMEIQFIY